MKPFGIGTSFDDLKTNSVMATVQRENVWVPFYESTMDEIQYYIAGYNGFELGTVVLFVHPAEIAGIHSMGVIPEFRRQGFARNILIEVLAKAKLTSAKMATLQASKAGEPLYKEIGFKENFKLYNYQLNKTN